MNKKKLNLKRITVASLDQSEAGQIVGGRTVTNCNPSSCLGDECTAPPSGTCSCGYQTCEIRCTTMQAYTCYPCIP